MPRLLIDTTSVTAGPRLLEEVPAGAAEPGLFELWVHGNDETWGRPRRHQPRHGPGLARGRRADRDHQVDVDARRELRSTVAVALLG